MLKDYHECTVLLYDSVYIFIYRDDFLYLYSKNRWDKKCNIDFYVRIFTSLNEFLSFTKTLEVTYPDRPYNPNYIRGTFIYGSNNR